MTIKDLVHIHHQMYGGKGDTGISPTEPDRDRRVLPFPKHVRLLPKRRPPSSRKS